MNKLFSVALLSLGLGLSGTSFSASDPISWAMTPATGIPANTQVGSSYNVTYRFTNNLPFAIPFTAIAVSEGGTFTVANGCIGNTLAPKNQPNSQCTVAVALQPIQARTNSINLTMVYAKDRVPLPKLSTVSSSNATTDNVSGHVSIPLPAVTFVGTSYPVSFNFINSGSQLVTATAVNVTGFTPTLNTCLTPLTTCTIQGNYTPTTAGAVTLGATYVYTNGVSKSVALSTSSDAQNQSGNCHQVTGLVALPFPTNTFQYADNVVKFIFTNRCNASSEVLGNVALTSNGSPTLTKSTDTCSGATLAANASCTVFASVVPSTVTPNLSLTATVPYFNNTLSTNATTSEAVNAIPNQATSHTVTFVNQCDQSVWYEFQNGNGGSGSTRKSPDPTPTNQNSMLDYQLTGQVLGAAPVTKTLNVNEYVNGAIYGRTGCDNATGQCQTANCAVIPGTGTCAVSVGAANPVTIFELTMAAAAANDGVYDVSVINGFNVPGQIKSLAPLSGGTFSCGQSTGALIQPAGSPLGNCSWSFSPPTTGVDSLPNYIWTSSGAQDGCTSNANCTVGSYCGTAFSAGNEGTTPINRRCGVFQGYWTIATYSGYPLNGQWGAINLYNLYNLGTALQPGPNGSYGQVNALDATFKDLYQCNLTSNGSLNSGYTFTNNVCGCYNWNQAGSIVPTAQAANCAVPNGQNSDWVNTVLPRVSWLKQACPTAYVYQYDDKSTSFTCNTVNQKTSYQITFCPGGKTGAPGT
jgi:hypothetical protein